MKEAEHDTAFILKEMKITQQEVWAIEEWSIDIISVTDLGQKYNLAAGMETTRPIRALLNIGITPSGKTSHKEVTGFKTNRETFPAHLQDNFELVEGWGQCF